MWVEYRRDLRMTDEMKGKSRHIPEVAGGLIGRCSDEKNTS